MRHRHVGADITTRSERSRERRKLFCRHQFAPVFSGDPISPEPIIVNERRARVFDRPADDARRADGRCHASSATELRSTPMSEHSISMVSPGLSQTGGSAFGSVLTGVPVEMISPGLSVMNVVT